ncbi:MAG: phytoene/squalene synthase family protein [Planctomycetes bacterium]|nr:phytoene/squalene synthase family protein [Planctomycetota bacterium]
MSEPALDLRASARYCRDITRRSATSFYYAFKTLPRRKSRAFEIVYAFMRLSDDWSDDEGLGDRRRLIEDWRAVLHRAAAGDVSGHPVMPALVQVMEEFEIPLRFMDELLDGTLQDLDVTRFADFQATWDYCYKVASVVGLVSLRIFGLREPSRGWDEADRLAIDCGQAFQLTNILRDLKEDMERDRVYLPQDELARFGLDDDDLRREVMDERFRAFMDFQVARAESYYRGSEPLLDLVARDARPCLKAMRDIYHGILERIIAADFDVWSRRASVPLRNKIQIAARAFLGRFRP